MEQEPGRLKFKFGLVGKNIDYSFSRGYFNSKFEKEDLPYSYENFDLEHIELLPTILKSTDKLKGLNVTIPYKEAVIPLLDGLDEQARIIGAVNTIKLTQEGQLIGYNTDYLGFKKSLEKHLQPHHTSALILGTGGASKAIAHALETLQISYAFVSRSADSGTKFVYADLTPDIIGKHSILINCTPLGTFPNIDECPDIPYKGIGNQHICYDLIYNPEQTKFLRSGIHQGALGINGLEMLHIQAEEAWTIWTEG